jgi:CHAD domain-containing protein
VLGAGTKQIKTHNAERKVRRLTRALGTVRELDVTLGLLDELEADQDLPRTAIEEVRARVQVERTKRREVMLTRVGSVNLEKLERRLDAVADALIAVPGDTWRRVLAARLAKRSRNLAKHVEAAGQLYAPEQLHQVRIAVKKLRYALELAVDAGVTAAASSVRSLKRVQEVLGTLHDLQVLQDHVTAVQVDSPRQTGPHEGLAAIAGRIEAKCRLLHARYVRTAPELLGVTRVVRTEIAPGLARVQRPIKMALPRRGSASARA